MKWNAVFAETAVDELSRLPVQLQQLVIDRIKKLVITPSEFSRPCPPVLGPRNCMQSTLTSKLDEHWHLVRVLFLFDANETDLHIFAIGHVKYAQLPPEVED
jgi:hypothetical protein